MKITSKIPVNHSITEVPFTKEKKRGFLPAFFLSFFLAPVLLFLGEWILKTSSLILLAIASISLYILKTRESIHIRFHHFFGIISGFLLFLLSFFPSYFSLSSISLVQWTGHFLFLLLIYLWSLFFSILIVSFYYILHPPKTEVDSIIILGCALSGKNLTPILKARTDCALRRYKSQIRQGQKVPLLIPSGGKGPDEAISEASAIQNYLLKNGIPNEHIRIENRSRTTRENMDYSFRIAKQYFPHQRCIFATSNYHLFRSSIWARHSGMSGFGIGAPTKWYYWPNAFMREFIGILSATWQYHIGIFLFLCIVSHFING